MTLPIERPTVDAAKVRRTFDRIERERGGAREADTKDVLRATAAELGLDYVEVREIMLDDFGGLWG